MKKIIFLAIVLVLGVGAFMYTSEALPTDTTAASKAKAENPQPDRCSIPATVKAFYNSGDGSLCGYLLMLEDGTPLYPNALPPKTKLRDGQKILIDYTIIEQVVFILECDPGVGQVMAVSLNCLQEDRGKK